MIKPSIKNLEYLLSLKKFLHFSKAAAACFVSQSTLSAGIAKLENDLQIKLVERDNKNVKFTMLGNKLVKQAELIISNTQDFIKIAQEDFFNSTIKIGVIPTIAAYLLPDFLIKANNAYPNLKITLIEDTSQNLLSKIEQMQLDFAIFAFPFAVEENIVKHIIFKDELHLIKHKELINNADCNDKLLLLSQGHCLREHILHHYKHEKQQIATTSCSSLSTLVAMINLQLGFGFLPKMAIKQGVMDKYPQLIVCNNGVKIYREIGFVYKNRNPCESDIVKLGELLGWGSLEISAID